MKMRAVIENYCDWPWRLIVSACGGRSLTGTPALAASLASGRLIELDPKHFVTALLEPVELQWLAFVGTRS